MPAGWTSSTPSGYQYHHLGWDNGHYSGYVPNSTDPYYPGMWKIDPAVIHSGSTARNGFYLHGGANAHTYELSVTHGCIRIRYQAIPTMKGKWDHSADNKHIHPGPDIYMYYQP